MVEIDADLRPARGVVIPAAELTWRYSTPGGPGGQHANRNATRAEVAFDIARSPSLSDETRARLLRTVGQEARAASSDHRSQRANRLVALERLEGLLRDALSVQRRRVDTRPTLGSTRRRLEDKRQQSARKQGRQRPTASDD